MDRNTAVQTWREVCGSDMVMTLPPTGRLLEAFAAKIEAAAREACAKLCEGIDAFDMDDPGQTCADAIRAR